MALSDGVFKERSLRQSDLFVEGLLGGNSLEPPRASAQLFEVGELPGSQRCSVQLQLCLLAGLGCLLK